MSLNPGQRDEYRRRHDALWPELAALLKDAGVSNYSIWLDEQTNILFAYLERPAGHRMDDLPRHPLMQRWWAYMADIMATHPDGSPVAIPLDELFHLE
jgi:L-rhamnose mutarotase